MRSVGLWLTFAAIQAIGAALEVPFADAVGHLAPRVELVEAGLRTGESFALYFTGDGGPDQVRQDLILAEWLADPDAPPLITAEDETEQGDAAFDAFGVTRIPSLALIDAAGAIAAVFEGPADLEALRRAASGGTTARAATPVAPGKRLLFFHAEWGRYSVEQREVLEQLPPGAVALAILDMDHAPDASVFAQYGVCAVPTLIVVDDAGLPLARAERVLTLDEILSLCASGR